MKEAQIQTLFRKHIEAQPKQENAVYELKICNLSKTKSFAINRIKEHQINGLIQSENIGTFVKIPDMPHFAGAKFRFDLQKPFDCLFVKAKGYVGICFYLPRKYKRLYLVRVKDFISLTKKVDKKSLREEDFELIDYKLIKL